VGFLVQHEDPHERLRNDQKESRDRAVKRERSAMEIPEKEDHEKRRKAHVNAEDER
jgi:hypothetical protein